MRRDVAELREVDAEEVPIRVEEADLGLDEGAKLFPRVLDAFQRRRGQRLQPVQAAIHRRPVDVVFRLEVEVERALADAGRIGNVADCRLPEPPAGEDAVSRRQNLVPTVRGNDVVFARLSRSMCHWTRWSSE